VLKAEKGLSVAFEKAVGVFKQRLFSLTDRTAV
jgi:hypothetical protein